MMIDPVSPTIDSAFTPDTLDDTAVHEWQVGLEQDEERTALWFQLLNEDEREWAARFHRPRAQRTFVVGRGALLEHYLVPPSVRIHGGYMARGKPALAEEVGQNGPIYLNRAHSSRWAVYAVAKQQVGAEIEHVAPYAYATIVRGPPATPYLARFQPWTLQEACAKACSAGPSCTCACFAIRLSSDIPLSLRPGVYTMGTGPSNTRSKVYTHSVRTQCQQ